MTPEEVENLSESFRCCFMAEGGCIECPRNKDEDDYCAIHLREDVLEAFKRLKFLETPTKVEQPELPGMPSKAYYTATELAKKLNVHPRTIMRRIKKGYYPYTYKAGGVWRIPCITIE